MKLYLILLFILFSSSVYCKKNTVTVIVKDALTNERCVDCKVSIHEDKDELTVQVDTTGQLQIKCKMNAFIKPIPSKEDYFGIGKTVGKEDEVLTVWIYPNKKLEKEMNLANECDLIKEEEKKDTADSTMKKVLSEAEFKGDINKFLSSAIYYPEISLEYGNQGMVFVELIIEKDGTTTCVKVIRGITEELDAEALRVSRLMEWEPCQYVDGTFCRTKMRFPINFRLN